MGGMLVRHEPTSASAVRHAVARDLELHDVDEDTVASVVLVTSELVTNAIRHGDIADADDAVDVDWTIHRDHVVVSVEDPSSRLPRRRHPKADDPGGRGLTIVEALSTAWGAEPTRRGKRVWAKLSLG
jgi:two-component sensor histidine kinase